MQKKIFISFVVFLFFSVDANSKIKNDKLWNESYNECHSKYSDPRVKSQFSKQAHSNYCICSVNLIFENFTENELRIIDGQMTFKSEEDRIKILDVNQKTKEIITYCTANYLK